MGVSARLLGMALISISGEGGVAEMRVDGERRHVFQGLAMLLVCGMSRSDSQGEVVEGAGSDDANVRYRRDDISPGGEWRGVRWCNPGGVGPAEIRPSDYIIIV